MKRLLSTGIKLAVLGFILACASPGFAQQVIEVEPNDPCLVAQEIGQITVPVLVNGSLDSPPVEPGVDFFRFSAMPDQPLVVDLEGAPSASGTLGDPFLGLFDGDCNVLEVNDDFISTNSHLEFTVNASGVFILAASSCCDIEFVGDGGSRGTYQLEISSPPPSIGSISGRLVDAASGQPLPGNSPPFAFVELLRCDDFDCFESVGNQNVDSDGRFRFNRDFSGRLLTVGAYQIRARADEYDEALSNRLDVGENENLDIGDFSLILPPLIGSITGRVVDGVSGQPIPGDLEPFATAELFRCDGSECFDLVSSQNTDSQGEFRFVRDFSDRLLRVGTYQVWAQANEFQNAQTEPFDVDEGEDLDVGDIALTPPPILFSDIQPCEELLLQGGTCRYSVVVNNNTGAPLRGMLWSLVNGNGLGSSLDSTTFEATVSEHRRSRTVRRQRVSVPPLSGKVVHFQFDVPSFVRNGATFCTRMFFGLRPAPLVNTAREGYLFCIDKGASGFQVMDAKASQALFESISGSGRMSPSPKALINRRN